MNVISNTIQHDESACTWMTPHGRDILRRIFIFPIWTFWTYSKYRRIKFKIYICIGYLLFPKILRRAVHVLIGFFFFEKHGMNHSRNVVPYIWMFYIFSNGWSLNVWAFYVFIVPLKISVNFLQHRLKFPYPFEFHFFLFFNYETKWARVFVCIELHFI